MKIRNGFVSNSSSSSFVVLIPNNFDIGSIDYDDIAEKKKDCECNGEDIHDALIKLIEDGYFSEIDDGYDKFSILSEILHKYVITTIDGGSDEGQIVLADYVKIKEILDV